MRPLHRTQSGVTVETERATIFTARMNHLVTELDDRDSTRMAPISGQFTLPDSGSTRANTLSTCGGQNYRKRLDSQFQVAEFRKPEFEVAVEAAEPELLRGTATEVTVQANYFFGGAASDLELNYTVFTEGFDFGPASPL